MLVRLDLDILFRVPSVLQFDMAPNAHEVAVVWNKTGLYQLHRIDLNARQEVYCTQGNESKLGPKYSPDSRHLGYVQDYQGDENFDIFLLNLNTGEAINLTPSTNYAIYPSLEFSPDTKRIAFVSNKNGKFSVYTMKIDGSDIVPLTAHRYSDQQAVWSPDTKYIAVSSLVSGQEHGIFIAKSDGSEVFRITENGKEIDASYPQWSPDSKRISFMSSSKGSFDVGIYDLDSHDVSWLTDSEHECYSPRWSPDGKSIIYLVNLGANTVIRIHTLENGYTDIKLDDGIHSSAKFSSNGQNILFLFNGPKNPSDLWMFSIKDHVFVQLTNSILPGIDTSQFIGGKQVEYSSIDGTKIPALLFIPKERKGVAVVHIHGGPTAQTQNSWNPFIQELLSRGYVVIAPNYRGSTGYGRTFREANRFKLGKVDLEDCVSAYHYLVAKGLAEPGRVAVTGGSYGGYLTMCALTGYPELWACGSALVPFINWFTEIANEREDLQYWDRENMGDPEKDRDRFVEASPIFFLHRVKAPVQLIGGAHDPRCPVEELEQAKMELERLGKTVEAIVYQDEGHGFRKLENRVDAYKKICSFISNHLGS